MISTRKLLHQRELLHQKNMRKKWNCFTRFSIYQEPAGGGRRDVFAEQYDVRPKFEKYQNNVILNQRQKCFPCNMCDWSQKKPTGTVSSNRKWHFSQWPQESDGKQAECQQMTWNEEIEEHHLQLDPVTKTKNMLTSTHRRVTSSDR